MIFEFLQTLTKPEYLASYFAGIAAFATIVTVFLPALKGDKLEARLKAVATQRERLRKQSMAALENKGLRKESKGVMSDVNTKLNLAKLLEDPNVKQKLTQAGFRGPGPVSAFYFFRFSLPFVGLALMFFYIFFVNDHDFSTPMKYGSLLFGAAAGFYAPSIYVGSVGQKRQASIMLAFPDALDMMLICVESGMSIEVAFGKVGAEIGTSSAELAEELTMTVAELSYLPDRRQAYENLAYRTGHEGVKAVCLALVQAERYGTPLGDALRVMAKENRDMRMSAAEKKAAALPAKLTVPMIIFFLPCLFLVVLGPAYIRYEEMQAEEDVEIVSIETAPTMMSMIKTDERYDIV